MQHDPTLSDLAVDAILRQIAQKADCHGIHAFTFDGTPLDASVWFEVDRQRVGEFGRPDHIETTCRALGAFATDPTDAVIFAGNRDELIARVGLKEVNAAEDAQADIEAGWL